MPIVLMTDFGTAEAYAGILKGVILRLAPATTVLDLTHQIPPYDILQGAFTLNGAYRFFPDGSIFVAVVDPGVGSTRKPIAAVIENFIFIAPDNGLLTFVLHQKKSQIFCLDRPQYHLPEVSGTFHARDIFTPVAAHLSRGVPIEEMGSPLKNYLSLPQCFPTLKKGGMIGRIISVDQFGNCFTNVDRPLLQAHLNKDHANLKILGRKKILDHWVHHYSEGPKKSPLLLWSSSGYLEIAFREGNAAKALKIKPGQEIWLE